MKNLLIALVIPFLAVACSSGKDEQKLEVTRENLSGEWRLESASQDGQVMEVNQQTYHVNQNSILILEKDQAGQPITLGSPVNYTLKDGVLAFWGEEYKVTTLTKSSLVVEGMNGNKVTYSFGRSSDKKMSDDEMTALYKKTESAYDDMMAKNDVFMEVDADKYLAMSEDQQREHVRAILIEAGDERANDEAIVAAEAATLNAALQAGKAADEAVADD